MKKTVTFSLALASVVLLSGCSLTSQDVKTEDTMMEKEALEKNDSMMKPEDSMVKEDAMVKEDSAMMKKDTEMMAKEDSAMMKKDSMEKTNTSYVAYSEAGVKSALKSGKKVVLFFHAKWCPSCKSADSTLTKETLPADTIVFKTDYDSNVALKQKYAVTSQHTFVSLKSDESMMKKASGISTAEEIAELF
jgi:thiol-disulfide isomerase/thioredoxin